MTTKSSRVFNENMFDIPRDDEVEREVEDEWEVVDE